MTLLICREGLPRASRLHCDMELLRQMTEEKAASVTRDKPAVKVSVSADSIRPDSEARQRSQVKPVR